MCCERQVNLLLARGEPELQRFAKMDEDETERLGNGKPVHEAVTEQVYTHPRDTCSQSACCD